MLKYVLLLFVLGCAAGVEEEELKKVKEVVKLEEDISGSKSYIHSLRNLSFTKKKVDEKLKTIPIIVITSKDLTEEDYAFLSDNVDQVIQKGKYTRKELIKRINTAIKESNLKMLKEGN